jgi:IS30 family transposase
VILSDRRIILSSTMAGFFLTLEKQGIIVGMNKARSSLSQISNEIARPKKTILGVLKRYQDRGSVQIAKKPGRLKKLQERDRKVSSMSSPRIAVCIFQNLLIACQF